MRAPTNTTFAKDRTSLAALALPLSIVGWTADTAGWVSQLPLLWPQALAALMVGYFIAPRLSHWASPHVAGVAVASAVAGGFGLWLRDVPTLGPAMLIVWLTWIVGWLTAWLAYRTDLSQWAFVPGLIALLVMLANLPPSLYIRLAMFLAVTAASVAVFREPSRKTGQTAGAELAIAGIVMGILVSGVAWLTPAPPGPLFPDLVQAASARWNDFSRNSIHFFDEVPNRREIPRLRLDSALPMTNPLQSTDDLMMMVGASEPRRWRLGTYETYAADGWRNPAALAPVSGPPPEAEESAPLPEVFREVRITVRTAAVMDQIATAGIPIEASLANVSAHSPQPEFRMDRGDSQTAYLPPDLEAIRDAVIASPTSDSADGVLATVGAQLVAQADDSIVVRRSEEASAPLLALTFEEGIIPPRAYESVGRVTTASPSELRTTAAQYPQAITDRYLQLPRGFPESVHAAAAEITSDSENPYDKALALQSYLRTLPYSVDIQAPPTGSDAVEWFLFESHTGFCTYYASAMITMMRSLGVPGRLAVGFAPGRYDDSRGEWAVEAGHYHVWPELYFPGFGWVEFEPTPAEVQQSLALVESPTAGSVEQSRSDVAIEPCTVDEVPCAPLEEEEEEIPGGGGAILPPAEQPIGRMGIVLIGALASAALIALVVAWRLYRIGDAGRIRLQLRTLLWLAGAQRINFETPLEMARRLASYQPQAAANLMVMASAADVASYSRSKRLSEEQRAQLRTAVRSLPGPAVSLWLHRWRRLSHLFVLIASAGLAPGAQRRAPRTRSRRD